MTGLPHVHVVSRKRRNPAAPCESGLASQPPGPHKAKTIGRDTARRADDAM